MRHHEDDKKVIPTILAQGKKKYTRPSSIRPSDNFTYYGSTKTKGGYPEISLALKLILENGMQYIIQYHEINSPIKFNGADIIEFNTPTLSVIITGIRLDNIIDYIAEHRLVWIKEPDSDFMIEEAEDIKISSIKISEKDCNT